jgi:tetratricopeptide (TPR) repeat protein
MKVDGAPAVAIPHFRDALRYDPEHKDALYYLAACLVAVGKVDEALTTFRRLVTLNPSSHRGLRRWGTLRALTALSHADLTEAHVALMRALDLNQEETGVLLALGELELLRGDSTSARERFRLVCQANARSVAGFFLRGYVAWAGGDEDAARAMLLRAAEARGDEVAPEGAVMEGDVRTAMHQDETPLAAFTRAWAGHPDREVAYRQLAAHLWAFSAAINAAE